MWRHNLTRILIAGLILSLVLGGLPIPTVSAQNDWIIDGDTVYISDSNAYLSATPHTLESSGWVEFELLSKQYEGSIDIVFGFVDADNIKVKNPQIWRNNVAHNVSEWVEVQKPGNVTISNILSYEPLQWDSIIPDIGSRNNSKLVRLTIAHNATSNITKVVAYNSYQEINGTTAKFFYNYTADELQWHIEYYADYKTLPVGFTQEFYPYKGVDRWYYAAIDTPIQKDVLYKARCWVEIPVVLGEFNSKYVWAVKPSGESIYEARTSGHLYILDPWLSGGWGKRVKFTADSGDVDAALSDFPIMAYLSTSSGYNSDDISFIFDELQSDANRLKIAVTEADGETQCYVEIEDWDDASEEAVLHIGPVSLNNTSDSEFYLYYDAGHGNNTAYVGDVNSVPGAAVWNSNFTAVYHLRETSGTHYDSTSNDHDTTVESVTTQGSATGIQDGADAFDGVNDYLKVADHNDFTPSAMTLELWAKSADGIINNEGFIAKYQNPYEWVLYWSGNQLGMILRDADGDYIGRRDGDGSGDPNDTNYHYYQSFWNGGTTCAAVSVYIDLVQVDDTDWSLGVFNGLVNTASDVWVGVRGIGSDPTDNPWNGNIDEVRVSNYDWPAAWGKATYESMRDELLDWGSEETASPDVDTDAASSVEETTALLNGNVTNVNGNNITERGFVWDTSSHAEPASNVSINATDYAFYWSEVGNWTTGSFNHTATNLTCATTYYYRAGAKNDNDMWGYGNETTFLTKPCAPTNVSASDGTSTQNVTITWTLSPGNVTGYHVYYDSTFLATVGNVSSHNDTSAPAPTITPGVASASDGTSSVHVTLSLAGESANNGTAQNYTVRAYNPTGNSSMSAGDYGYRGVGVLAYQWMRSAADADAGYGNIAGATTDPYNDTASPAPTITANNATASDGISAMFVTLSANETASDGDGRWFLCALTAAGAATQNSTHDRGYRGTTALTYQWWRSAADADANYSTIAGGTTDPYNDVGGVHDPDGRYYLCTINMTGAASAQNTTADRGYMAPLHAPNVTCSSATSITTTSAVLHGNVTDTGGANVTMRGFEWGYATGNYTFSWNETAVDFGVGSYNHSIGSLNMCDEVFWRAFAVNSQGTGNSTECSFNTTCGVTPTVTCSAATSVTTTSGVLNGEVTDAGYLNITMRGFEWGYATGNYTFSWNETSADFGTGAFSHSVGSLNSCTTIYWRAFAVNSEGTGNSTECTFATSCGGVTLDLTAFTNVVGFGIFFLAGLVLLGLFLWRRLALLAYGSAGAFAVSGFQAFGISGTGNPANIGDIWMALFWLCVGFTIGMALIPSIMREKPEPGEPFADDADRTDIDGSDLSQILPDKKPEERKKKEKKSRFAEQGEL